LMLEDRIQPLFQHIGPSVLRPVFFVSRKIFHAWIWDLDSQQSRGQIHDWQCSPMRSEVFD
jgi:hypothetical protein